MLKKKIFTETEVLKYYTRLGARGRSPVWTPDDFVEADWAARLQGISIGIGLSGAAFLVWSLL